MLLSISILCVIFLFFCIVLGYKLYQFSIILLDTETAVEESIEILNERYISMSKILEKEIFFDSVEVRQVVNDIKISRDSLLNIAENLTSKTGIKTSEIKEKDQSEKDA
jgi:hypothetical protein|tara:strand:- start:935 stop:1261 length:327 start_codon:yes stop_codon:yes gene_type:complete